MISPTTAQTWTPDGLIGLIVPPEARLLCALSSMTARRLIDQGAGFYTMPNGSGMLSLRRPPGGIPTAISLRELDPDTSPSEVTPCAA